MNSNMTQTWSPHNMVPENSLHSSTTYDDSCLTTAEAVTGPAAAAAAAAVEELGSGRLATFEYSNSHTSLT